MKARGVCGFVILAGAERVWVCDRGSQTGGVKNEKSFKIEKLEIIFYLFFNLFIYFRCQLTIFRI